MMEPQKLTRWVKPVLLILFGALLVLLFVLWQSEKQANKRTAAAYAAMHRVHATTVDKLGRRVTEVSAIVAQKDELLAMQVHKSDSLAKQLQTTVKEAKGRVRFAAAIATTTAGRLAAPTLQPDSVAPLQFRAVLKDEFITATVIAGPDSVILDYRYTQRLDIWHTHRNPIFGPPTVTTHVRDLNPHAVVTDAVTYEAPGPRPRRGIWAMAGAAAVFLAAVVL